MFFVVQFPFTDARKVLNAETDVLPFPLWPLPELDKEFIRSSGIVRKRTRGGLESWPAEEVFCDAWRALRFTPFLRNHPLGGFGNSLYLDCVFRRFLFDGTVVSRVEVGFKALQKDDSEFVFPLCERGCLEFINACLSIKVKIPCGKKSLTSCELSNCSKYLAKHFLRSTTKQFKGKISHTKDWWFSAGAPLILVEHNRDDIERFPKYSRVLSYEDLPSDMLHYCIIERAGVKIGVWFICTELNDDKNLIRKLRMHLFRLHAEIECLKQILRFVISDGPVKSLF
jgi:hypothetical protein